MKMSCLWDSLLDHPVCDPDPGRFLIPSGGLRFAETELVRVAEEATAGTCWDAEYCGGLARLRQLDCNQHK